MKSPAGDAGALWVCKGAGCGVAIPAVIVAKSSACRRRETADFTVRIAPAAIRTSGYNARGSDGSRKRRRKYLWPAL